MRSLLLVLAFSCLVIMNAQATEKLLDCNIPSGGLQQVVVLKDGNALTLKELADNGIWASRPLSLAEWQSRKIKLTTRYDSGTLIQDRNGWWFSLGYTEGYADCE